MSYIMYDAVTTATARFEATVFLFYFLPPTSSSSVWKNLFFV